MTAHPPEPPPPHAASPIEIPSFALVVLVGPSGCGKSTFARRHFAPTEIVSSDACRAMVADDENDQDATRDAFDVLHLIVARRLARRRLTVVDATNLRASSRRALLDLARRNDVAAIAVVLGLPLATCLARHGTRGDRGDMSADVIERQHAQLQEALGGLRTERWSAVHLLGAPDEIDGARFERIPLGCEHTADHGPFDIVGDVHGCIEELRMLLAQLGYEPSGGDGWRHPAGRRAIFVGDLVDRGPESPAVLRAVMAMVRDGDALCLPGNHDDKLRRWLEGRAVQVRHGLELTVAQLGDLSPEHRRSLHDFLDALPSHLRLDDGRLVVAHAGLKAYLQGRESRRVRDFALYGETTGELDELGLPVRLDWAAGYRGSALVVYGHTPVREPRWLNGTVNIDTGCAFGGRLTALRYPEMEFVSVPALRAYATPSRPFLADVALARGAEE